MDTPGNSELMGMQSSLAYQGCPVCLHSWSPDTPLGQTKCVCDGYRRFLPQGHPARETRFLHEGHVYQYNTRETRPSPKLRDNEFVKTATAYAALIRSLFLGHKCVPQLARWPAFSFRRYHCPDLIHGKPVCCVCVV